VNEESEAVTLAVASFCRQRISSGLYNMRMPRFTEPELKQRYCSAI
jgi:hypothetical protein